MLGFDAAQCLQFVPPFKCICLNFKGIDIWDKTKTTWRNHDPQQTTPAQGRCFVVGKEAQMSQVSGVAAK